MRPVVNAITLAVDDLDRALSFYRDGLGLPTPGIVGTEFGGDGEPAGDVVMFTLENGLVLALYSRTDLALDAGVGLGRMTGSPFSLGWFVHSREEVEQVLAQAQRAGGTIVRPARERPWPIYAGYFADPDGYLWEVVYFHG
ncbi:VOC family protein [Nocardia vaccinii]|uniref:VOC family protein n=1 Tax=Nocardia vaccinii TaxID=1822 RepID=UPI000829D2DD|nr:VOC family protein [Nocardia vaccinii]